MRKIYLLILFVFVTALGYSQVSTYTFSQTNTTYTAITGGTLLGSATNDEQFFLDPANLAGGDTTNGGPGFPIGFNFTYNGNTFDRFGVQNNGWIALGQSTQSPAVNMGGTTGTNKYFPLSSTSTITPTQLRNRISGLGTDIQGQTGASLRYQTIGSFPNRILVVQWTNYRRWNFVGDNITFQIRLHENGNQVSIVYNQIAFSSTTQTQCQVGLGGSSNTDFNNRATLPINGNWNTSFAGTANTDGCFINTGATTPTSGLTYNWGTAIPCTAAVPTTQASALNVSIPFTTATISWANGNGARRMVVVSNSPIVPPVNNTGPANNANTVYAGTGQQVVYDGTGTTVNVTGLTLSGFYYIAVFEYNYCINGTLVDFFYNNTVSAGNSKTFSTQPQNDFCFGPTTLTPSCNFATGAITGTLLNATVSGNPVPSFPTCQFLAVDDVWYTVVVPASGNLTIETQVNATNSVSDTVLGVFVGADCFGLTQIACDDNSGPAGANDLMAKVTVSGRPVGEILYIGVWNNNVSATVTNRLFKIAAYDSSLTTTNTTTATACGSYTWVINGTTYTTSGTYTAVTGCVTQTLNLTITPSTNNVSTISRCDTYTWPINGTTYTTSGTYTNVVGCHTETLNLTITPSTANATTVSRCNTYTWPVNGTTYTSSGTYIHVTGCHTETLNLSITPSTTNVTSISRCDTYTWPVNGTTYTTSGTYTHVTGCHTETLNLTITPSTTNATTVSRCNTYTWPVNGTTYTTSGTYTHVTGCHTETLNLTITLVNTPTGLTTQVINGGIPSDVTIEDLIVSGNGIVWYPTLSDATNGTNPIASGTQLTNNTTYFAVSENGTCRSNALTVTVTVVLDKEDFTNSKILIYPNPTNGLININESINSIEIIDINGRVVKLLTNLNSNTIDVSEIQNGMYFLKFYYLDKPRIIKIIKN